MNESERKEQRKKQIEEMTDIWTAGDDYSRGFLEGTINAVIRMASKDGEREETDRSARPA